MAKKVVIDAGHGGSDSGAIGNGIIEKNLTLDISKYIYDRLKELGVPVKLTRDSDVDLPASERPQRVLDQYGNGKDVIVISNHINAGGAEGAEVIYALRNKDTLAKKILDELEKQGQLIRKYYQRRLPSDYNKDYYYMLRNTPNTEALIVEYGFLDNASDANKLKNNYKKYAEAVVKAVTEYAGYKYVPLAGSDYYVVKKGDTLWSIARAYGLTVDKLKSLNNLTSNNLTIGDSLIVKDSSENSDNSSSVDNNKYYIVKKGDSLYSIARRNNMTVDELKSLNNLTSNILSIGQKLIIISGSKVSNNVYVVKKGDTLWSIANNFNVSVNDLKNANNKSNNSLSIGEQLIIPGKSTGENVSTTIYTVKSGDNLYSIARRYNVTVNEIKSLNNLSSNLLSIGQKLSIPI